MSDHDRLLKVIVEVKWHRWLLIAVLADALTGWHPLDPSWLTRIQVPWP